MKNKFAFAFQGIVTGLRHRSIIIQFLLGFLAILAGFALQLTSGEWIAVVLAIVMVIAAEMLNTCIELLCDMYTREYNEMIKAIKDIAAGAGLVISLGALVTAMIILFRHFGG